MTELLLVRHGRPESGHMDPPLTVDGREQARALGQALRGEGVTALLSSDLRRARETAGLIAQAAGLAHVVPGLPGLREWGLSPDVMEYVALELMAADHPKVNALAEGRFMDLVPDEVDAALFRDQVRDAFATVLAEHAGGRVAVVCHGGVINAYVGQLLGVPDLFWFHPDYTSVSRVQQVPGGRTVVRSLNEVHHLDVVAATENPAVA